MGPLGKCHTPFRPTAQAARLSHIRRVAGTKRNASRRKNRPKVVPAFLLCLYSRVIERQQEAEAEVARACVAGMAKHWAKAKAWTPVPQGLAVPNLSDGVMTTYAIL